MSATLRTVEGHTLSPVERNQVADLASRLVESDLPDAVRDAVTCMLDVVADGRDVFVSDVEAHLTPNQAARLVGLSRPLLNQLLDDGHIAYFETGGGHRKLKLADVRAYIEARDAIATALATARAERGSDGEAIASELGLDADRAKRLGFS